MDLLLVTNLYPPQELGGYGRCMADFCWGLLQLGHRVQVISSDAPYLGPSGPGPSGEPVSRCLTLKGSFEGGIKLIDQASEQQAIDQSNITHLQTWIKSRRWDGVLLGNLDLLGPELLGVLLTAGVPVLHHIGFVTPPFAPWQCPQQSHYQMVAASMAVRTNLAAAGVTSDNAPVIYPGARVDLFHPAARRRHPGRDRGCKPLRICFAGLMMGTKGPHTLLEAMALLLRQGIRTEAILAGGRFQPDYYQQLTCFAASTGLEHCLVWAHQLRRDQLARMFELQQVFVFPSTFPEAFGIVAAEAMASGLALVSSGVGGAAELFEDGVSGLRFEPGNAVDLAQQLQRLAQQPGLLEQLQQAGAARVREQFSVTRSAQQLEALFHHHGKGAAAATKAPNRGNVSF